MHMDKIIGRQGEKELLERLFSSKKPEFIALYGRRRVGKTYLIRTFFTQKKCTFFHITGIQDGLLHEQLYAFTRILESTFYDPTVRLQEPTSWNQAFEHLTHLLQRDGARRKIVLFFDELPWLASQKSGFLKSLDYYWNRFWSTMPHLKLVVCGSAASWMIENLIHHKGGLHNRTTCRIALAPFTLRETKTYLYALGFTYTDRQVSDLYMTIGGIPYYLNFLDKKKSVPQNIDTLCFHRNGPLLDEFRLLFTSLFHHSEAHEEIIRILAKTRQGMPRRALLEKAKLSSEGGSFLKRLEELEASGFITRYTPYGHKKRSIHIQLIDEYALFYTSWIEPARSTLEKLNHPIGYWVEQAKSPAWKSWAGYAFESLCFKHLDTIRQTLGITANAITANWRYIPEIASEESGAQIDLLFDRTDGVITLCEIKYTHTPYKMTKAEAQVLSRKIDVFKRETRTQKQITLALVTDQAPQPSLYTEEMLSGVVTLKDLMGQ